jgi:hypothetical protein
MSALITRRRLLYVVGVIFVVLTILSFVLPYVGSVSHKITPLP